MLYSLAVLDPDPFGLLRSRKVKMAPQCRKKEFFVLKSWRLLLELGSSSWRPKKKYVQNIGFFQNANFILFFYYWVSCLWFFSPTEMHISAVFIQKNVEKHPKLACLCTFFLAIWQRTRHADLTLFIYRRPTLYPLEIAVDFLKSL